MIACFMNSTVYLFSASCVVYSCTVLYSW